MVQVVGSEERRRTLTPLALRERYNALNEPGLGKSCHASPEALSLIYISTELPVMVCMALALVAPLRVLLAWRIFSIYISAGNGQVLAVEPDRGAL